MSTDAVAQAALAAQRHRIRHSAAHVMADAITSIWPQAKLTIGPPTDDGFYYDIDLDHRLTPEDLKEVERRMRKIIGANDPFVREEISREDAQRRFAENEYKLENIAEIPEGEVITTYSHGRFTDLCEGPHVERAGAIKAVKLLNVAGAYWRGDERNPMLQRIYGTAFESKDALRQHIEMLEEAAKRDHRKVGRELELFMFDPAAPASPFFLPKGTVLYNLLIDYIRELYQRYGYQEVMTPQIFESGLWRRSGHYENYKENMFFVEIDEREFGVKPMNCPSHALIYGSTLHSYRDLPVRLADFGRLHRYERSGVTHGLTRVRSFAQDDAHIFCRPDQVQSEVTAFIDMVHETFTIFGFDDVHVMLSLRPEKRVGTDEMWDRAEAALTSAIESKGLDYEAVAGEGAFYGPKIDFFMQDALRRQWQLSTVQLDYSLPERFGLEYVTEDDRRERPVLIPPRPAWIAGAVYRHSARTHRRGAASVALAGAGGGHPHRRPARRLRPRGRVAAAGHGSARRGRRPHPAHEPEDTRGAAAEGPVHARRRRPRARNGRGGGAAAGGRGPRRHAVGRHRTRDRRTDGSPLLSGAKIFL